MWISSKTRYGLKAIYEIARNDSDKPISLNIIAEKHNISLSYLEQIMALLKKENLIKSTRGSQGGYTLADNPKNISIGQIILALEGSYSPTSCVNEKAVCDNANSCITRPIFTRINDSISNIVDNMTLQDLMEENKGDSLL
jgi:Rrf2 family cysteine metabolism transcriptional repressor